MAEITIESILDEAFKGKRVYDDRGLKSIIEYPSLILIGNTKTFDKLILLREFENTEYGMFICIKNIKCPVSLKQINKEDITVYYGEPRGFNL